MLSHLLSQRLPRPLPVHFTRFLKERKADGAHKRLKNC